MIARTLLGLTALLPAALNAGPATASSITVQLCSGDGARQTVTIPIDQGAPAPGEESPSCHAKGCHGGGARKRAGRHI